MSLLPSKGPEVSTIQEGEMKVLGVDEDVESVIDALASDTARTVLNAIYEDPGTASEIADRLGMSIQKVSYHLDKLEGQDLIEVAGIRYSAKGQEMKVYEPPDEPLVLFVGTPERKQSLKTLVRRLLPTVGILALGSALVQHLFGADRGSGATPLSLGDADGAEESGDASFSGQSNRDGGGNATSSGGQDDVDIAVEGPHETGTPGEAPTDAPMETPTEVFETTLDASRGAIESASQVLSPGLAFFLGGILVLCLFAGWWVYRSYA